jgi:hypothetical protein
MLKQHKLRRDWVDRRGVEKRRWGGGEWGLRVSEVGVKVYR